MKVKVKRIYYKHERVGQEPIKYHASQPKGRGTDVNLTIRLDPSLRRHKDLRDTLVRHEINEAKAWGKGSKSAHSKARAKEPSAIKNIGGVSGYWKEIKRREGR